jgi:serine/threonine protein kinase
MVAADGPNKPDRAAQLLGNRYEILNPLGSGAMGFVYQAFDRRLNRLVAIKAMSSELDLDTECRKRFEAEAKLASTFSHPNLAAIYDYGVDGDNTPYIVMEFVDGNPLDTIVKNGNKLRVEDAVIVFQQVAEGLHHAHKRGVVHRDLKPGNIIITKDDAGHKLAKLVDFGLAKTVYGDKATRLTKTGDILGTPLYMSPEQITGQDVDCRSDIYSLGCVMFHCLTGDFPFRGRDAMSTAHMHVTAPVPDMHLDAPDAGKVTAIIRKCLEKKASDRFATALDVADALSALNPERNSIVTSTIKTGAVHQAEPKSKTVVIVLTVSAVLLVAIALVMLLLHR